MVLLLGPIPGCYCSHQADRFQYDAEDAGADAGQPILDSGPDADRHDGGNDGGNDAGRDALVDAGPDAAEHDAYVPPDGGPTRLPDLMVTVDRASRVGGEVRVEYTVRNVGEAPSGPYRVDLWADRSGWFSDPPGFGDVGAFSSKPSLDPGASQSFTESLPSVVIDLPAAWAIVDTMNAIDEIDEANNISLGSAWSHTPLLYTGTETRAVNEPIPDADAITCVRSTMMLGTSWDSVPAEGIAFSVSISHDRTGDLSVEVLAPRGERRQLFLNHGGDGQHLIATTFTDQASQSISVGSAPFSGEYRASGMWTPPLGRTLSGTWTLRVCDTRGGNVGVLNQWAISYAVAE